MHGVVEVCVVVKIKVEMEEASVFLKFLVVVVEKVL
jgi:hypothetical protein